MKNFAQTLLRKEEIMEGRRKENIKKEKRKDRNKEKEEKKVKRGKKRKTNTLYVKKYIRIY